jgi:hypothetical protein
MSLPVFGVFFVFGAAAVALWITVRFPKLSPERVRPVLIHMGIALLLAQLVRFGIMLPVSSSAAVQLIAGIFAVALPILVYSLLIFIWLLRIAQNAIGGMLR